MSRIRASKGMLLTPAEVQNVSAERREKWLKDAELQFVAPGNANRTIYKLILDRMWPVGSGIPGPQVSEQEVRQIIDDYRVSQGEALYKDPFRRMRELQGEEGFTCIVKEGTRYQLQTLQVGPKRIPREKPTPKLWKAVQEKWGYQCSHCGASAPQAKFSPDHRVPRSRGGGNEEENWQPLCEQCNNLKSSSCQGCTLNCYTCSWAFPESYKPIIISDENRENIKRVAETKAIYQSELANQILQDYFLRLK